MPGLLPEDAEEGARQSVFRAGFVSRVDVLRAQRA
jgi:hypothetical protein